MKNKIKNIFSTSIGKSALILTTVIFGFYLLFNLFAFFKLVDLADRELDKKVKHEIEHVDKYIDFMGDSLFFHSKLEFEEEDFQTVTDNAYFLQIYNSEGNILFSSPNTQEIGPLPLSYIEAGTGILMENRDLYNMSLRFFYKKLDDNENIIIQLATPRNSVTSFIKEFEVFNLITLPIILLLILLISFFLSSKSYQRLSKIIDLADKISARNISQRIEFANSKDDVYERLKDTLNNLFERLETQIGLMAEFSNNASHQLISPLTSIKAELEFILKSERSKNEYVETLGILSRQTERMINIVQTLILLAREEDSSRVPNMAFSLNKMVTEEIAPKYSNYNIDFEIEDNIFLRGSSDLFGIVLHNLLENALKYSREEIKVNLTAVSKTSGVLISVTDTGIGIEPSERERVFEKFYRSDSKEVLSIEGTGLGLSIVKVIVNQMGGSVEISENKPKGTIFILKLPSVIFDE